MTERIGVLGGTFDPFHNGHLGLAREILGRFGLTRIILVPVNQSPQKKTQPQASAADRLAMLRLGLGSDPSLLLSDIEIRRGGTSYSIDTLTDFHILYPESEIFLILGADAFNEIGTWKDSAKIMADNNIIIGARPGHIFPSPENMLKNILGNGSPYAPVGQENGSTIFQHTLTGRRLFYSDIPLRDISSREIRKRIIEGMSTKNLLPAEVEQYIIRHQLYQSR